METTDRPVFCRALRTGLRCGLVLGMVVGAQEGIATLHETRTSWGNIATGETLLEILRLYFTPVWVEGLTCALLALLPAIVIFVLHARFAGPDRTAHGLTAGTVGLMTAGFLSCYALFCIHASVPIRRALGGAPIHLDHAIIFVCLLMGIAVSLLFCMFRGHGWCVRAGLGLAAGFLVLAGTYPMFHFLGIEQVRTDLGGGRVGFLHALVAGVVVLAAVVLFRLLTSSSRAGLLVRWLDVAAIILYAGLSLPGWLIGSPDWETNVNRAAEPWERDLNVILISVDTLRGDRLQPGSRRQVMTPNFNRLAAEGVSFTDAEAPSPWTLPSLASMHSSFHVAALGSHSADWRLSADVTTLAEVISRAGLATKAVLANGWLNYPFGLHQGFENYEFHHQRRTRPNWWPGLIFRRVAYACGAGHDPYLPPQDFSVAGFLVPRAVDYIEKNRQGNFFLWIHLVDPHDPFVVRGRFMRDAPAVSGHGAFSRFDSGPTLDLRKGRMVNRRERRRLEDLYNLEVRYTDDLVGHLLEALARLDMERNTLLILTSDHGEEFWDHDDVNHGHSLYRELLHIPLIIRPPRGYPVSEPLRREVVRLIDVAPTILDFLGLDPPVEWAGASLLPLVRGEENGDRPSFAGNLLYYQQKNSVRLGRYKYIHTPASGAGELYDLEVDPFETANLVEEMPAMAAELSVRLHDHRAAQLQLAERYSNRADSDGVTDERQLEELRALGYIQ